MKIALKTAQKFPNTTEETASRTPYSSFKRPAKRQSDLEDSLISFMNTPVPNVPAAEPNDDDRSFFESLIPIVRTFTVDQKLDFRSGVLDLAKKIRLHSIPPAPQSTQVGFNAPGTSQNYLRVPWQYSVSVESGTSPRDNTSTSTHSFEDSTESMDLFHLP